MKIKKVTAQFLEFIEQPSYMFTKINKKLAGVKNALLRETNTAA